MFDQPKDTGSQTTGGALNIPDDKTGRIGSDAELKGKTQANPQSGADPNGVSATPVERFDPPAAEGEERIFQNGDTDR